MSEVIRWKVHQRSDNSISGTVRKELQDYEKIYEQSVLPVSTISLAGGGCDKTGKF